MLSLFLLLEALALVQGTLKTVTLTPLLTPREYSLQRGVDRGPDCSHNSSLGPELRGMGTSLIRTHDAGVLDWCFIFNDSLADPTLPSSYNFGPGDAYFAQIIGEGFRPYLRLGTSWSVPNPDCLHPDPSVFAIVSVYTLRHYNDGWAGGFAGKRVAAVEIWNEPDGERFWNSSASSFYTLFDTTARALKAYDPTLVVGGPGVASPLNPNSYAYSFGLLDYVAQQRTPIDFFSWHTYGNIAAGGSTSWGHSPQSLYNDTIQLVRAALESRGLAPTVKQHITEWQPVILGNASVTGGAEAASFTASALTFMAAAPDVEVSVFYPACEGTGGDGSWGMFDDLGNGTLRWRREGRAWGAVGGLLGATPWALAASSAPSEVDYTVLAGCNSASQGGVTAVSAVISARATSTDALTVTAELGGAQVGGMASVAVYLLTNAVVEEGVWTNYTTRVGPNGLVQVSVQGFLPPAVAWVTVSSV